LALTHCNECKASVSTEAAACPKCGAPPSLFHHARNTSIGPTENYSPKRRGRFIWAVLALCLVPLFLWRCAGTNGPNRNAALVEPTPKGGDDIPAEINLPSPPRPSQHRYSVEQDGNYGYEGGLSAQERQAGQVSKPMTMVRYIGFTGAEHRIRLMEGSAAILISCKVPCDIVKITYFGSYGEEISNQFMRATEGSVIYQIVSDAKDGFLKKYSANGPGEVPFEPTRQTYQMPTGRLP